MPLFFYKLGGVFCKHFPVQCFFYFCLYSKGNEKTRKTCLYGLSAFAIAFQYLCAIIEEKYFVHKGIIHWMVNIPFCAGVSFQARLSHAKGTRDSNNVDYMELCPKLRLDSMEQRSFWRMATVIHPCPASQRDWCCPISAQERSVLRYKTYMSTSQRLPMCYLDMPGAGAAIHMPGTSLAMGW